MKLVTIDNDEIRLCSGMKEEFFGKTNYDSIVTQKGLLVDCKAFDYSGFASGDEALDFNFTDWSFEEIKALQPTPNEEYLVYYCGKNPFALKAGEENKVRTLLDYFEAADKPSSSSQEKEEMFKAAFLVCAILTQAAKDEIEIPVIGAGGILVDLEAQCVLFLPPDLFKYSAASLSDAETTKYNTGWINPTLFGLPAICFERASIAYKMLTGCLPYASENATERNADILDRNFLPLELSVKGVDRQLAIEVNKALKLNSNEVAIPGKKKQGKSNEDLTPIPSFPLKELLASKDKSFEKTSDAAFEEQAQSYLKAQKSKIKTQRTFRRNKAIIYTSLAGVLVLAISIFTGVKNARDNFTTKGLTSTQTIEAYFKGYNNLDTALMEALIKGRTPSEYVDTISRMYVVGKQRQAYGGHKGFLSPEKWLYFVDKPLNVQMAGIYGVSNVMIDGKLSDLNPSIYKINQKPEAIEVENGITLENNSQSVHNVEYFFIRTEGENTDLIVQKVFETFTLTYVKDKWLITNIESDYSDTNYNSDAFKLDYFEALNANDGNVKAAVGALRNKYKWLPGDAVLEQELHRLEELAKDMYWFTTN